MQAQLTETFHVNFWNKALRSPSEHGRTQLTQPELERESNMFDFIKRMFGGGKRDSHPHNVAGLDVVEGNDIEILKTSDYAEGVPDSAIDKIVAEHELPPAGLDLMLSDSNLPEAELDEPSAEPDPPEAEPDNFLLGDLDSVRKHRAMQTSKAGMQYWSDGLMKYRPRSQRQLVDGTNVKQFNYFEVLRDEPILRKIELQHPGMSIDHLNLQRFIHKSLKGKMLSQYVLRGLKLIREQNENGVIPIYSTANGADVRDEHNRHLRDMFNAYEAERAAARREQGEGQSDSVNLNSQTEDAQSEIDEVLTHFEELFEQTKEEENEESYRRWLLSVAEDATVSDDILWLLVEDPNPDVRFCLAENYNIDPSMLKALSEDENPYVAHRAQKTLMRMKSPAGQVVDRDFGNAESSNRFRKSG